MSNAYTVEEIIKLYKNAKNKVEEIQILAELTNSDIETIVVILQDNGVYEGDYRICRQCGCEFPRIYVKQRICPECRENNKMSREEKREIARLQLKLKQNVAKMQELGRESARIRERIRTYEQGKVQKV